MLSLLIKPLIGVASNAITGMIETKKAKQELKITEIKATQKLREQQIAGNVAWEQSAVDQMKGSWKDEVSLVVLLLPAVLVFTLCCLTRFTIVLPQFIIYCNFRKFWD